jgi:peroxiredoxin Q/BCP
VASKRAKKGPAKKKVKAAPKRKAVKATAKRAQKAPPKHARAMAKAAPKSAAKPAMKAPPRTAAKGVVKVQPPLAIASAKGSARNAPKGAPVPMGRGAKGAMRAAASKGAAGKGGGPHAPGEFGGEHEGLEFEGEPPVPVVIHEPPIPTPSRRKPKPGSPDWPGESLTVGMEAPDFSLPSTLGRKVTLSEFRGRRVVLYFYPKDDTPGCTMEACAFRDNLARVTAKDAVILGVSLDDELSHQRFAQKYNLQFPLLSDVDAAICRRYGTYKEKSLYGRNFWGVERTTFVIDREGKVENVFRRVKVEGHADEVLATLSV